MKVSLKAARINANLTQKSASELIGVAEDTLRNWEKGKTYPDAANIQMIEKVYSVQYNDLIFVSTNNA